MTPNDLRILCTALAFAAVIAREGRTKDEARRAKTLARLIESFCLTTIPDALGHREEKLRKSRLQ